MKDRGTMKWTSILLPEHIEMLNKMWQEQENKEMPELDEQQILENKLLLQEALEHDLPISIKHFANYDHLINEGFLLRVDGLNQIIYLEDTEIKFNNIIEVNLL